MKRTVISIIGTRPEFIKIGAIDTFLNKYFNHHIINTNQHYDKEMSGIFLKELKIQTPKWTFEKLPKSSITQTAEMMAFCQMILEKNKPDLVLVYGDTNSTLAGALAAVKLNIKIGHIEAGMRSYDKNMPEEINRIICDHISTLFFCSSEYSIDCLKKEGLTKNIYNSGDINYDIFLKTKIDNHILNKNNLKPKNYFLATIHRQENTDNLKRLIKIITILEKLNLPVIFPLHPRTEKIIKRLKVKPKNIIKIRPQNFTSALSLQKHALAILTDSGGVQKEAYWLSVPCITLRSTTEWPETVKYGWNHLTDLNQKTVLKLCKNIIIPDTHPKLYGDGHASEKIVKIINNYLYDS